MDKKQLLDKIAKEIEETHGGPYGPGLRAVPGEGTPNARILWVGEAPGVTENQLGRPFVGVSGQLLRRTMQANGFLPEENFITNIIKFRPPENRDPSPEEIEFFKPFLDRQIEIIDPEIIVTVGRYSMYKFLGPGVSISRIHGIARKVGKFIIFPMFHSAAALRDGNIMRQFVEDFRKLRDLVEGKIKVTELETAKPAEKKAEQLQLV